MTESIIVAIITGCLSLVGVYIANRKSAALQEYKLDELRKTVEKHNQLIDRVYRLEERTELQEAELHRHNERLKVLEQ